MSDVSSLETFPNPRPERDYTIEIRCPEFTSMCPITGHPDFATITVRYVADQRCVELKSLKLYFHAYRNEGIFFEAATNKICDDLGQLLRPRSLTIIANWKARGGFTSRVTASWAGTTGRAGWSASTARRCARRSTSSCPKPSRPCARRRTAWSARP